MHLTSNARRVIPAQAGIHAVFREWQTRVAFSMDPGLRRDDIVVVADQARIPRQNDMSLKGVSPDFVALVA